MMQLLRRQFIATLMASTMLAATGAAGASRKRRRPNIITIVLDDVGYSDFGCFGAEIRTPNIDRLAAEGLRYVRFDTKAVCSSTRAALLTGRNSHTVNVVDVPVLSSVAPGQPGSDRSYIPDNAKNIAQVLKREGYTTWAIGKWHLIPGVEIPADGPRNCWPRQRGFDYFYGFARGWTDQYKPALAENNVYVQREFPEDYHLSVDLTDKALSLIEQHVARPDAAPFYMNLAYGVAHAPIQVPREYSRSYDDVYARGWDIIRSDRYARMKKMGVIPANTLLPERSASDRAWTDLDDAEKLVFARHMAVYAGFIAHCDEQIGRLLDLLDAQDIARDTLIVLLSDNGAAAEAGQEGQFDGLYRPNTIPPAEQLRRIDELGTAKTQTEYPRPWALAGTTPLRRYKLWPYSGGTRTPMIVRWPAGIADVGAIRKQFIDVIDIAPTLLAAAGTVFPTEVDGIAEIPVAGRSFLPTFDSARAPGRQIQYFELRGNRAITDGRWRAVAMHDCGTPFESDKWELFDLDQDFSEATDLSARYPQKLIELQALWTSEWHRFGTGPMQEPHPRLCESGGTFAR